MDIAIAYDSRQGLHFILRVVAKEQIGCDGRIECVGMLNDLLTTKTPPRLLKAINDMPSLYPGGYFAGERYAFAFSEAAEIFVERFAVCDESLLKAELWLDSAQSLRADTARITQFVRDHGTNGKGFLNSLRMRSSSDCVVLAERLQDWMTLRNSLSVCARLLGQLEGNGSSASLEDAGFHLEDNKLLGGEHYLLPFKFNTFYALRGSGKWEKQDPLFAALAPAAKRDVELGSTGRVYANYPDPGNNGVFFAAYPVATQDYPTSAPELFEKIFRSDRREPVKKTHYFLVRNSGNQAQMAKDVVNAFTSAFRTLEDPGSTRRKPGEVRDLGWMYDKAGEFEKLAQPRLVPQSLVSALWFRLIYHPVMKISICKFCGNAVVSREQGTPKAYCTDTCRVQDANRRKREEARDG